MYPVGHPHLITENFGDVSDYYGLVKCTVLPPRDLYHPVLPYRCNNKLVFPLCRSCAEEKQQQPCHHTDEQRSITGTFTTIELEKALEKGYRMIEIQEVWHFEKKSDTLFKQYIDTFLKLKQENSGWPDWCLSEEDKQRYIQEYFEREGVQLAYEHVQKNPGLRSLAKLMLNR